MNTAKIMIIDNKYDIRILTNGYYCGIGKRVKTWPEAGDFMKLYHIDIIKILKQYKNTDVYKKVVSEILGI